VRAADQEEAQAEHLAGADEMQQMPVDALEQPHYFGPVFTFRPQKEDQGPAYFYAHLASPFETHFPDGSTAFGSASSCPYRLLQGR
jgi:hypothetical protein